MRFILYWIVFLFAVFTRADQTIVLKSTEIRPLIETRNERVSGKSHQVVAMERRQGYLVRSFLPSLKLYSAQERFELGNNFRRTQPTYGAEVSVNLFNGTKDSLYSDVVQKRKERVETEKRITTYEEIIKAKEIYWNLVFIKNAKNVIEDIQIVNTSNLKSAEQRIRAGVATSADRFAFEIKATEIQRARAHLEMQKKILERELVSLLGYPENTVIQVVDELEHKENMENIGDHTELQHQFLAKPSLVQAEENQLSAKIQSRAWWPKVDAYAAQNQYNVRTGNVFEQQEGKETVVGVRVTMNLSDFTTGNREASALKAEAAGSKAEAMYLVKKVENEAHSEIATLDFLHKQLHDAEANIERAKSYYKTTMSEYGRGVKNSPDVLGSVDQLYEIKTKYFEILRDFYITRDHLKTKSEI